MNENRTGKIERRKVSQEARDRYEEFSRERADVEHRLELVAIQAKVLEHVTNGNGHT